MSPWLTAAKILAWIQAGCCGIAALILLLVLTGEDRPHEQMPVIAWTACLGALAVAALAFLFRYNWARVFLAGVHSLLALGWTLATIAAAAMGQLAFALLLTVPLAIALGGAFTFVAVDVRAYCGEHVVVGRGRPGADRA